MKKANMSFVANLVILIALLSSALYPLAALAEVSATEGLNKTPEEMTKLLGPPNGRYFHDENEYWLYDNYLKEDDDGVYFPEFIIKNGKSFQVNWVPTDRLAKSLEITAGFKDFRPPDVIKKKDFFVTDTRGMEVGKTKADVIATLGEPDYKWVFNAKEIWDYLFVPFSKDDGKIYRLYFEFDGDKVTQSYGN